MLMSSGQEDVVQFCGGFPGPSISANIAHIAGKLHRLCIFVQNDKLPECDIVSEQFRFATRLDFIEAERGGHYIGEHRR